MIKTTKSNNKPLQKEAQKVVELKDHEIVVKDTEIKERIDRKAMSLVPMAQYKLDTDRSLYENLKDVFEQGFIDADFDKEKYKGKSQINSGLVVYEDKTHRTEIIFEGSFEVIGNYIYNAQTEKIKDALEEYLITQYQETQNPTIFIKLKDLAKEINVQPFNLRKRIVYIMESLQTLRISYKAKGKLKNVYTDFASTRIISSSEYHESTDLLEVNFDNRYAFNLATHKFFQLPKKYRQISDNAFQYAYPLSKYIFELCRQKRYKIKFKTLYDQIKKIPRIEDIRKTHQSPTQKIYEPLIKHFNELNAKEDFTINFENEDFMLIDAKKNIDFDKMLETNIIITWKNKPDYTNLDTTKKKYQEKIINERAKLIAKAMNRKALT